MTSSVLKFLDLFKSFFRSQGVDYTQLRAIVGLKLEMDNRRVSTHRFQQAESANAAFVWTFVVYFILGGFLSLTFVFVPAMLFAYTIYHAYLMVMLTMTLISDFSSVLLDTSDNTIVLPKPISNKTFYTARATHILIYIGLISFALAAIPLVVTFIMHGFGVGVVMLFTTLLTVLFSTAITHGLYLLLMRFTSQERLKSLINYFQIGMAILMTGGYQILPRLFDETILEALSTTTPWWSILIPPMWMATALQMANHWSPSWLTMANIAFALTIPVVLWKVINQYLTPRFTEKLADLGTTTVNHESEAKAIRSNTPIGSSIAQTNLEKASFNLASFGFARDRKLKLRMYPSFGYFFVLLFVFLLREKEQTESWMQYVQRAGDSQIHLFLLYVLIGIITTVAYEIHYTDDFKAAWIFQSAPIENPGELLMGTMKSIFIRFLLPLYSLVAILVLSIWRVNAIADVIFGFLICVLLMLGMGIIGDKNLPLSLPAGVRAQGSSMARSILIMLAIVIIGIGHYFLSKISDWALWPASLVAIILCWLLINRYKKIQWNDIGI